MDRLQTMQCFLAVVDAQGFAPAARKLKVSPPVVTRAVAELEERLGVRLLTRSTRVVRVTEAGARYAEDCRRLLAELDDADAAAAGLHGTPRGTVTLTASALFGRMHVMPVLTEFLQRHPEVDANALFLDRVVNLLEEGIDLAVRIGELPDSTLVALRVGQVRRVVCSSTAYLAAHGRPAHPRDLAQHLLISACGVAQGVDWRFVDDEGGNLSVRVQPRLTTTSNDAAIAAALDGFGLAQLMCYQVADHVAAGRLVLVLEDFDPAPLPVHLVHPAGRRVPAKVRVLMDMLAGRLRALLGAGHGSEALLAEH